MAEGSRRQDQVHGAAETMRRGAQQAARDTAKLGAEVIGRTGKAAAQHGDAAMEATARRAGEAVEHGAEVAQRTGAEVVRRAEAIGAEATDAGSRQFAQGANGTAASGTTPGQATAAAGMVALPQAFAGILADLARTNWQIGQEMLRLANPVALIELQQKMLHGYLDLILAGQAKLDRTARSVETATPDR